MKIWERKEVLAALRAENERAKEQDIVLYADAFLSYQEASRNIEKNGQVTLHPRTGAPFENPYLKVRAMAFKTLRELKMIKSTALWE